MHTCEALVITCIDFRIQHNLEKWLNKTLGKHHYDRVALAGGVFDFYSCLRQIEISDKLHQIKKVILVNHEDCGAYGESGTKSRHADDLKHAEKVLEKLFNHLEIETYYAHLNGKMEAISKINPRLKKK